ncbi:MAG: c-type cytochrome [Thermoleophilia bacterium]
MVAALTFAALLVTAVPVAASEGSELYSSLCASCHGAQGEGRGSFPALAQNPVADDEAQLDSVIRSGKGIMPPFSHLSEEDIAALVGYVRTTWGTTSDTSGEGASEDGAGGGTTDTTGATGGTQGEPETLPPGDATEGASLFVGAVAFESGAPPCVSCHVAGSEGRIAGSRTLGTDLTDLASRAGGAVGVAGMLAAPAFPVMLAAYEGHPLTGQERAHLGAYFEHLAAGGAASYPLLAGRLWIVGALGAAVLFALMGLLWPRRRVTAAERLRGGAR